MFHDCGVGMKRKNDFLFSVVFFADNEDLKHVFFDWKFENIQPKCSMTVVMGWKVKMIFCFSGVLRGLWRQAVLPHQYGVRPLQSLPPGQVPGPLPKSVREWRYMPRHATHSDLLLSGRPSRKPLRQMRSADRCVLILCLHSGVHSLLVPP